MNTLLKLILFSPVILAFTTLYSGKDCQTCLAASSTSVCKHKSGTSAAYCCSAAEMATARTACGDSPLCSNAISNSEMRGLTCPHERTACGSSSPEIGLSLGMSLTLRLSNFFDVGDSCYYHIFAKDRVSAANLDPYNRKYLQVYVESLIAMTGYIGSYNTGVITDVSQTEITKFKYNFTVPYSDDFYLILQSEDGSSRGDYKAVIQFSYYEYDPNCVQFTYWNGTACEPNYDEYCASFD